MESRVPQKFQLKNYNKNMNSFLSWWKSCLRPRAMWSVQRVLVDGRSRLTIQKTQETQNRRCDGPAPTTVLMKTVIFWNLPSVPEVSWQSWKYVNAWQRLIYNSSKIEKNHGPSIWQYPHTQPLMGNIQVRQSHNCAEDFKRAIVIAFLSNSFVGTNCQILP